MPQPNDLSRSLVALDQDNTIIAVVEMSQSSWLVAGMLPGIERQPRKKLEPSPERDRRTERKQLIRLYYEHSWVIGSQIQREFDITRCLQNNSLLHV